MVSPSRCFLALLATLGVSRAQQAGSIRGSVQDKDFDSPLPSVKVAILETGQEVQTSDQGDYVVPQVAPGRYTVVFSKDGYARVVRNEVVVSAGQLTEVSAALAGDVTEMEEFVVEDNLNLDGRTEEGLLQLRFDSPSLMNSISADLMNRAGASDAAGALRLVAGASVQDGKSAVIRGLPDRYVSSQMNGVRLPSADEDKRAVELDQFPSTVLDSIQVSKTFTPDQQGDASGGAVNIRLRGVPQEPFFVRVQGQASHNTQITGRSDSLTSDGGGLDYFGRDDGRRDQQLDRLGFTWDGAVGVTTTEAPIDYKWSFAAGGRHEIGSGLRVGGFASLFYERDSTFQDQGFDDSYWVEAPGAGMTPRTTQGRVSDQDFKTNLFDVKQGERSVRWGGLGTLGIESDNHALSLTYLYTRVAEDGATMSEDTRGKQYFYPGYEPDDPTTPGHGSEDVRQAPYLRLETIQYTERTTDTLQLQGRHTLPEFGSGLWRAPKLDWTLAKSTADSYQPDKRQFGSLWVPGRRAGTGFIPPTHSGFKPAANFTLGNLQRIWTSIDEESDQYSANLSLPFKDSTEEDGYFKVGIFRDDVKRGFDQDTFSNFTDNSTYSGSFEQRWSQAFPFETHPITESLFDVDYQGSQTIAAWYSMLDLPLTSWLRAIGGARFERTKISIVNTAEEFATWFPPGSTTITRLNPGDADVNYGRDYVLPSLGLVATPFDGATLRLAYNETVARQTFKELTPILQQEFLGGPIFIGNPALGISRLKNFDVRLDYEPAPSSLLSVSWFRKDISDAIEYIQSIQQSFDFTTPVNYPRGRLLGWEFEARQGLDSLWEPLSGFTLGANATLLDATVVLPEAEARGFDQPNIRAPIAERDMTNAPAFLYNLYATYDTERTGTQIALFYTVQGDTLLVGAGQSDGNFVPSLYAKEFDTLNFSITQRLGPHTRLQFAAKNLTDPDIETVYRSKYIGDDVTRASFTRGIEFSLTITGEINF